MLSIIQKRKIMTKCWIAGDGVFSSLEGGHIKLVDLKSNKTTNLISVLDVKDVRTMISIAYTCF